MPTYLSVEIKNYSPDTAMEIFLFYIKNKWNSIP